MQLSLDSDTATPFISFGLCVLDSINILIFIVKLTHTIDTVRNLAIYNIYNQIKI